MLEGIEIIFQNRDKMLKHLKGKSYIENTEIFIEKYGYFFREMSDYMKLASDETAVAEEIAVCFIRAVRNAYENKRGKIKSLVQLDLNLFMIYYVFPTILSRVEKGELLADSLCMNWNNNFSGNDIQYADYATLQGSFNDKIFGIL